MAALPSILTQSILLALVASPWGLVPMEWGSRGVRGDMVMVRAGVSPDRGNTGRSAESNDDDDDGVPEQGENSRTTPAAPGRVPREHSRNTDC